MAMKTGRKNIIMLTGFKPCNPKWRVDTKKQVQYVQTLANIEPGKLWRSSLQCTDQSVISAFVYITVLRVITPEKKKTAVI